MKGFKKNRKALPVWKVLILIFAGFIGVAGVTALVLYLTGRFDEEVVPPNDLAFVETVDGEGMYEDGIYKLSGDVNLTIVSSTESVTESKITLSLANTLWTKNGYTSDGVIIVPVEVELNQAFKVELVRQNNSEIDIDWIVGSVDRNSRLTATSENILIGTETIEIAVDTPVSSMGLAVDDEEVSSEEVQNVVVGSTFNLTPKFLPSSSQYLFNDKSTSKRVFYQVLGSAGEDYISYDESSGMFYANQISGSAYATVNAYAFSNSYYQETYFAQNPEATNDTVIAYLQSQYQNQTGIAVYATIRLRVLDIEVSDVKIEPSVSTAEVYVDKYFTLSTNSTSAPNDMSLGVTIIDSEGRSAPSLLGRVGIKLPKDQPYFSVAGGRVMKVTTEGDVVTIEEEEYDPAEIGSAEDNVEYYLLPYAGSNVDYNNYRWSFSATAVGTNNSFDLSLNFFYKNQDGTWVTFFDLEQEQTLRVEVVEIATDTVTLTTANFDMLITFNNAGTPIPAELNLTASTEGNRVYERVVYFLYDNTTGGTVNVTDVFECGNAVSYNGANISISGISAPASGNYNFYEISGTRLIAKKTYSGSVVVFAALVRTNADGEILLDNSGKYQFIAFSSAREINVDSTLSISNMSPTFSFVEGLTQAEDGQYYLPAINRNEDGSVKNVLSFELTLTSDDIASDVDKLISAFGTSLRLVCCDRDGNEYQDQYLTLNTISEEADRRTENSAVFTGDLIIEEAYFTAGTTSVDYGRAISLKLVYDDGREVRRKFVGLDEPVAEGEIDYFYIYYQQPVSMTGNYEDVHSASDLISVDIATSGLQISWGDRSLNGTDYESTIANLNNLLTFTIYDIYGQEIEAVDGVYDVRFVEEREDSNYVLTFNEAINKISDFVSTNGTEVETSLKVYVIDKRNDSSYVMNVNPDTGAIGTEPLQSELFNFKITSEGIDYIRYDKSTDVESQEWEVASSNTEISVSKLVTTESEIELGNLFEIYTTSNADEVDLDYEITFDGTWLQGFQSNSSSDADLKKMIQIKRAGEDEFEGSGDAESNISSYQGVGISALKINAPFGNDTTLVLRIRSTNNLYSVTLRLTLYSDIEINRSFENYQSQYADYLATSSTGTGVSIFADELYDLDTYLSFTSENYSWKSAFSSVTEVTSDETNGLFYEGQGVASINLVRDGETVSQVNLNVSSVTSYTTITVTLYYGVRSSYAFNIEIALYVNPNIVIVEYVDQLGTSPNLDLNNLADANLETYYGIYKATSYITDGTMEAPTGVASRISELTFNYVEYVKTSDISVSNTKAYFIKVDYERTIDTNLNTGKSYYTRFGDEYILVESPSADALSTYYEKVQFRFVKTSDVAIDSGKTYYVETDNGFEAVQDPVTGNLNSYYERVAVESSMYELVENPVAQDLAYYYEKVENSNGFISIIGNTFRLVSGKEVDILNSYKQEFGIYYGDDEALQIDALKAQVAGTEDNAEKRFITYSDKERITIGFTVSYNSDDITSLVGSIFPETSVVYYDGEYRLLVDAGEPYNVASGYTVENATGNIYANASGNSITALSNVTFVDTESTVKLSSTVADGTGNSLQINISLGVIVSNVGREFVYYTNDEKQYNSYQNVGFDKLISNDFADLEENGVYETLTAGQSYDVLRDISDEYTKTTDEDVVDGKTYYVFGVSGYYEEVEAPIVDDIDQYYEKNDPQPGIYYNSEIFINNGANRNVSVEIVTSGVNGYIENLATCSDGTLTINSLESKYTDAYIVLRFTISTTGSSPLSYSWYYRIKVEPNFIAGEVHYPYNNESSSVIGEFLDTDSEYYDAETLTYTIDPDERLNSSNSSYYLGYRFGDIEWIKAPSGTAITENFELVSTSSNSVSVSFDGGKINITYKDASSTSREETVTIRKYWSVNGIEVIGSSMEYIFRLNQAKEYSTHLYIGSVQSGNEQNKNSQGDFNIEIKAGEDTPTVLIPTVSILDSSTEVSTNFKSFIKGDNLELLDALQFKSVIVPAGTRIYVNDVEQYLTEDLELASGDDWMSAVINTTDSTISIGEYTFTYLEEKGERYIAGMVSYNETLANVKIALDDLYIQFLQDGTLEYFETRDTSPIANKTYYFLYNGEYTEVTFEEGQDFGDVTYYEKYRTPYQTVSIMPKANISKDSKFVIGIYTEEGVVQNINLNVKSYIVWTVGNTSLESGKTYTFGDLISNIESEGSPITDIKLNLKNGEDIYRQYYLQTSDVVPDSEKTYYTRMNGVYSEVSFEEGDSFTTGVTYYELGNLTLADIIEISGEIGSDLDLSGIKIEIAPLVSDATFEFDVVVTADDADYTFGLSLEATASFDENLTRQVQDNTYRYGGVEFEVLINDGTNDATIEPDGAGTPVTLIKTESLTYEFVEGDDYEGLGERVQITPKNVGETEEGLTRGLFVVGKFNGKEILSFSVTYRYSVLPNVNLTSNYPNPDGNTNEEELANYQYEYISATDTTGTEGQRQSDEYSNFFGTSATFASGTRVVATRDANASGVDLSWVISISSMSSNVAVYYSIGTNESYSNYIDSETANKLMYATLSDTTPRINVQFVLLNTASNGEITFDIRVNEVLLQYKVIVINNSIVTVTTNAPNYNLNRETVYAEDLAEYETQTLFTQNRILNYTFRTNAVTGTSYYVRLSKTDGTDNKIKTITVSRAGVATNLDLGNSFSGYYYAGTFSTFEGAQNNDSRYLEADDTLFLSAPKLTSRIVVNYYDGREIIINDSNYIILGDDKADSVVLTSSDHHNTKEMAVSVRIGRTTIETSWTYNLYLESEFGVSNTADSAENYSTITINAGEERSLLDELGFDIYNTRTGNKFSNSGSANTDSFADTAGVVTLQLYGIELGILNSGDNLTKVAYQIHNMLSSTEDEDGIKFSTGLNPRAGVTLTSGLAGGSIDDNYVTHSAVQNADSKNLDFSIRARGANNDGNHVMFRITYTVTFGDGQTISISHNLLLKVLPNSNVNFLMRKGSTSISPAGTEIIDGQTVASNYETPFSIQNSTDNSFYLWNASSTNESAVQAYLYGNTTLNNANIFTYKYVTNEISGYNDFATESPSPDGDDEQWRTLISTRSSTYESLVPSTGSGLQFDITDLSLGQKYFYVTAEDHFGYKLKFYFTLVATENPQIAEMTGTGLLTEGQSIAVGAQYLPVSPTIVSVDSGDGSIEYRQLMGTINYTTKTGIDTVKYANEISNINASQISKIYLVTQSSLFGTLTKTYDSPSKTIKIWDVDNDNEYENWKMADGNAPIITSSEGEGATTTKFEQSSLGQITIYAVFRDLSPVETFTNWQYLDAGAKIEDEDDWEEVEIVQPHSTSSGYISPTIPNDDSTSGGTEKVLVTLRGISAYAYPTDVPEDVGTPNLSAINTSVAASENYTSRVNDIKVTSIEFYYQGTNLRKSASPSSSAALFTSSEYSFYTSSGIRKGIDYETGYDFTVPVIDGIYYGTGSTLSNVEMRITLADGAQTCTLSRYVTIQRAENAPTVETPIVLDNTNAPKPSNVGGAKIYNDTLEVVLESGASVSFAITATDDIPQTGIITLTNSRAYTVTEYVGISANTVGLSTNNIGHWHVYVTAKSENADATFVYDGSEVSIEDIYTRTSDTAIDPNKTYYSYSSGSYSVVENPVVENIGSYHEWSYGYGNDDYLGTYGKMEITGANTPITLHINDISEVSSTTSTRSATLYFLWKGTETSPDNRSEYYQMVQTYSIYPYYSHATSENVDTSGNIEFSVDEYYKAEKGSDYYYIIPRSVWGTKFHVIDNLEGDGTLNATSIGHRFTYEISQETVGGAGAAFIDENGTIVTDKNFSIGESTITVNVYLKVSGQNGFFDQDSTKLRLCTFRMGLESVESSNSVTATNRYGTLDFGVVSVPSEYTLWHYGGDGAGETISSPTGGSLGSTTIACEVGQTLNFHDLLDENIDEMLRLTDTEDAHNITYHIVNDVHDSVSGIVYYNNLNTYTITSAGSHKLTLIVAYRTDSADEYTYKTITVNVMAYDVTSRTNKSAIVTAGGSFTLGTSGTWYQFQDNGSVKELTDRRYTAPSTTGVYNESFVSNVGGSTTIYTYTFYVVDTTGTNEMNVVLNESSNYTLSNLGYDRFFVVGGTRFEPGEEIDSASEITVETTFTTGANNYASKNYIARDASGVYKMLTVTYYFTSSASPTQKNVYVQTETTSTGTTISATNLTDAILEEFRNDRNLESTTGATVYEIADNTNIMTTVGDITIDDSEFRLSGKKYLIIYNGTYYRYTFDFYTYSESADITISTAENSAYPLANANEQVKVELGIDESATISYYYLASGTFRPTTTIDLSDLTQDVTAQYYVRVYNGSTYTNYLVNFTFKLE